MELSVSGFLLTLSLVYASPYGYGAKSGAVAKAEASAGAFDALPLPVLPIPGSSSFSGSFSKSSSSSFASSSATSSSSSFSYSGNGAGLVPEFEKKLGCGGGCQNGVKNDFTPSGHEINNNGGFGGQNIAGASATAGAVSNSPHVNQPCHGPNCLGANKKCNSQDCGGVSGGANGKGHVDSVNSASDTKVTESNDFSANHPHLTDSDKAQNGNGKLDTNHDFKQAAPVVPFDKKQDTDCEGSACGSFRPLTPRDSIDNNSNKKPESPYQEQACATHDCSLPGSSTQKKPSSYNVPILGPHTNFEKENPSCTSGNCENEYYNHDEKRTQKLDVNKPATTLQLPTGPSNGAGSCSSKDCYSLSYQHGESSGSDIGPINKKPFSNTNGPIPSPSYNYDSPAYTQTQTLSGPNKFTNPSTASSPGYTKHVSPGAFNEGNFGLNPSYMPNIHLNMNQNSAIPQKFENNNHQQSTGAQNLNNNNLHDFPVNSGAHVLSGANDKKPANEPSQHIPFTKSTGFYPDISSGSLPGFGIHQTSGVSSYGGSFHPTGGMSSHDTSHITPDCISGNCAHPSSPPYAHGGLPSSDGKASTGSNTDFICSFGKCGPQSGHPILNKALNNNNPNVPSTYVNQVPTNNQVNNYGCTTPNCQPLNGYDNDFKNKHTSSESSIIEKFNPSKTDSEILLTNKGNKIYSGGFGGPAGVLSTNNYGKPNSGIVINPDTAANQNAPHNFVSSPQFPSGHNSIQSIPAHSNQIFTQGQQPANINNSNKPASFAPIVPNDNAEENKRPYSGGFGGPAGLLKPNEFTIPTNTPKVGCSAGNCNPSHNELSGAAASAHASATAAATANANASTFSGTFGGPPGLLKPYDEGKPDQIGKNVLGKAGNYYGNFDSSHVSPSNGMGSNHAKASATAGAAGYGHPGGCNSGCSSNGGGQNQSSALGHSGVQEGLGHAGATASAKSVATSYAQGKSISSASAHASAVASAKGGAWR